MRGEDMISAAIARRSAQGLSVEATGIRERPEPFTAHFRNPQERDAYIARCHARGEVTRIV